MIRFGTSRFGQIEVPEERVIIFPQGLLGFPELKRYILMDYKDTDVKWLQAVDDPDVAFIVINPFLLDPGYRLEVSEEVKEFIGLGDAEALAVLVILRIDDARLKANLQGPIVINSMNRRGVQLVLDGAGAQQRFRL